MHETKEKQANAGSNNKAWNRKCNNNMQSEKATNEWRRQIQNQEAWWTQHP
jgi:hypothetical protein